MTETFSDGSTITTDDTTGNRTVVGVQAHREYFRRLNEVKIFVCKPEMAVVACCTNLDGTRKAELIRRTVTNSVTREWAGDYTWEVWSDTDPERVIRYTGEFKARRAYRAACLHGTNP